MRNFDEIDECETKRLTKDELKIIGENVHSLRMKGELTLVDVAFYTFTNVTSIWRLEKGLLSNITLCTLMKLCQLFKVKLPQLLERI